MTDAERLALVRSLLTPLQALAEKATPLPWMVVFPEVMARDPRSTIVATVTGAASNPQAQADAHLIVALVNALPALTHALASPEPQAMAGRDAPADAETERATEIVDAHVSAAAPEGEWVQVHRADLVAEIASELAYRAACLREVAALSPGLGGAAPTMASASPQADADTPLFVGMEGPCLVIRIGVDTLAFAADQGRLAWGEPAFKVTDAVTAAVDILRELRREEEDGTTVVHKLFDQAALDAWENGGEGFTERDEDEDDAESAGTESALPTTPAAPPGTPGCDICHGTGRWTSKEGAEIPCDFCPGTHEEER